MMGEALRELGISLAYDQAQLDKISQNGPVVFIANHPFGVVDGLAFCHVASMVRSDFAAITNAVLCRSPLLQPYLFPIDFRETKQATAVNLETRTQALAHLERGGSIVIFPSGGVATAPFPGQKAVDLEWKRFVVKMIQKSRATVVPIFFPGQNSFWFHLASYIHMNLRLGLLLYEMKNKMNTSLPVVIGDPIPYEALTQQAQGQDMLMYLRKITLALGEKNHEN
jgi:putative hemolysin